MEEEDNIIVKWAQEDVETSYNLLNNNKIKTVVLTYDINFIIRTLLYFTLLYFMLLSSRKMN